MKTIIAGTRTYQPTAADAAWLDHNRHRITEVVCGNARGPDTFGRQWAYGHRIPVTIFAADWDGKGRMAGYLRNSEMARYADVLVAFWDGQSFGTKHMIQCAKHRGLKIIVRRVTA